MSDHQESVYSFREPEPSHYEAMPGIIDYLTYIEEVKENDKITYIRKRLRPVYKDIYRVMKKLAGSGVCMRDVEYISAICGCSKNTLTKAKKIFQMPFEQLDGNSLMHIEEKRTLTKKDDKNINRKPVHVCTIEPIWKYNNPFMEKIYRMDARDPQRLPGPMGKTLKQKEAEIAIEKMNQPSISETVHNKEAYPKNGTSRRAHPKIGISPLKGTSQNWDGLNIPKQNPMYNQQPMAEAIKMSLINQKDVGKCFESEFSANEFLEVLGFRRNCINELFSRFSLDEMLATAYYLQKKLAKKKLSGSLSGYFLSTLENRWWKPKRS